MNQRLSLVQGDADTFTEVITNIASLSGYTAKLYIWQKDGTLLSTITGSIATLTITYQLVNETTKVYPVGELKYETKIFDASDHVYTSSSGILEVKITSKNDPT